MAVTRHSYAGNAPDTTLASGINASVLSITIADGTGWPTGSNGPFVVDIDNGESAYEKVLVDSRSGTTLTVNASGRGWDDTSGSTHASAAVIRHVLSAAEIEELNAHASNEAHPHTAAGLDTDSVTTVKILDANVTNAKLAATGLDISKFTVGTSDRDTTGNAATATTATTASAVTTADTTFTAKVYQQNAATWEGNEIATSTNDCEHYVLGSIGVAWGRIVFSGTGSTGENLHIRTPLDFAGVNSWVFGTWWLDDTSTGVSYSGIIRGTSSASDLVSFIVGGASVSNVGATVDIATGDELRFGFAYMTDGTAAATD